MLFAKFTCYFHSLLISEIVGNMNQALHGDVCGCHCTKIYCFILASILAPFLGELEWIFSHLECYYKMKNACSNSIFFISILKFSSVFHHYT